MREKALLIVDMQNDFCPGGKLPIEEGDIIIDRINWYIDRFKENGFAIIASRDWHPSLSSHFKDYGGNWPAHCIQETEGASFHPKLKLPESAIIISKGIIKDEDGYSAFDGSDNKGRFLSKVIKDTGIKEIFVCGLATDYCVKASVLSALNEGFKVYLLTDAIKGVNLNPGDSERAKNEMSDKGAILIYSKSLKL